MLLRKLGKRGTAIIEYVILLSFVAVIGTSFTSDSGMGGSIKSIITNVEQLLGLAAGKGESKVAVSENAKQWSGLLNDLYGRHSYMTTILGALLGSIYLNFVPLMFKKNK